MLDLNFIRKNQGEVERAIKEKGYKNISLSDLISLDDSRKELQQRIDTLRTERNEIANKMKNGKPEPELIERGKQIKIELAKLEENLDGYERDIERTLANVPNILLPDVPLGDEEDSVEIKAWGDKKTTGVDHLDYTVSRNWIDFDRGAKVAGTKFYFIKNELALLENALVQYGIEKVMSKGFNFMTVPHMVNGRVLAGTGFAPRTSDQSDEYFIEGEDLALIATAEISLTGYHMDEIIDEKDLPLFYAGYSPCYRKEAGAAGKHTRGLFRVHQFNKLEMYAFCTPEQSQEIHEKILAIEEEIWQELNIPYHVINIAAGDLGAPAAKKYDIEYWSPVDQKYREITSCSNCTDFQARSVNTRVRRADGSIEVLHTLNGTAISLARTLVAVIENYAQPDGKLQIPTALRKYFSDKSEL